MYLDFNIFVAANNHFYIAIFRNEEDKTYVGSGLLLFCATLAYDVIEEIWKGDIFVCIGGETTIWGVVFDRRWEISNAASCPGPAVTSRALLMAAFESEQMR